MILVFVFITSFTVFAHTGWIKVAQVNGLSVALPGEQLLIKITLPPELVEKHPKFVSIKVVDHQQREQWKREIFLGGEPQAEFLIESLNIKRLGYFRAFARIKDKDGNIIAEDETSFAIVPEVELKKPLPESPFGIGAYYAIRFDAEELKIAAQLQRRLGAAWNRDELLWDLCEPQPGKWQWESFDRTVKTCRENNILIIGLLDYWGKWAKPLTDAGYKAYANYAFKVVNRYRPEGELAKSQNWQADYGIRHWEIWNEPATFWSGTGEQFGTLLAQAYAAVKKADPRALVFFDNWGESFDTKVIATAGRESFDGVAPHYYCPPRTPEEGAIDEAMKQTVDFFHRQRIRPPFWITEMGWQSDNTLLRQKEQANFLVRSYVLALAAGMDKVFWYNFVNDGRDKNALEFGLLNREDFTPKVGYAAYAGMVKRLLGTKFFRTVEKAPPVRIYIFQRDDKTMAVLWSLKTEGALITPLPEGRFRLFDIMGNQLETKTTKAKTFTLPLSPEPVYLETTLRPEETYEILNAAQLSGIALLNINIFPLIGTLDKGTSVCAEIENYSQKTLSGLATIKAPPGWVTKKDSVKFPALSPKGKIIAGFEFSKCQRHPDNLYPVEISITTDDGNKMIEHAELAELVATYGTPSIDGNLADWEGQRWINLNKERQAVGLQPYSDWNLSAKVATQWNETGFYFGAIVTDNEFYQPFTGDLVWQGDNFQLAFDTALNRGKKAETPEEYLYGLSLTTEGAEVFRWRGANLPPSLINEAKLVVAKTPEGKIIYESFLPASLLKPMKFEAGTKFGFSFILNDNDGGGRRGWLEWTPGIGTGFNSQFFTTWTLAK